MALVYDPNLAKGKVNLPAKIPTWLCCSTCQGESLTKQLTYGPT